MNGDIGEWVCVGSIINGDFFNSVVLNIFVFEKLLFVLECCSWNYLLLKYLKVDENIYWKY